MKYRDKTKGQLLQELNSLERRLAEMEKSETECKHAEEALKESEEFSSGLLQKSPNPVIVINPDTSIRYVNPAMENLTGYTAAEIIGKKPPYPWWRMETPEALKKGIRELRFGMRKGRVRIEQPKYRRDGKKFWVMITSARVERDGEFKYYLSTWTDITRRRRAEEALRESEERYRLLFNKMVSSSTLCEVVCDETGKPTDFVFLEVNPAWEKTTGLKANDVIGKTGRQVLPRLDSSVIEMFGNVALTGEPLYLTNLYSPILDRHWETTVYSPRKGQFAATSTDITERKQAEEELRKYRGHLEELVEKRTAELLAVNKKLEQEITKRKWIEKEREAIYKKEKKWRRELEVQMKQRIDFTRAVVHELKTPLTALLAASDLLVADIKEEPYATLVSNIQQGTLNLDARINELLDLARGEMGMLQLKYRLVDLLQLLQEMANYVTPEATKKHQSLILDLPPSLPIVQADQERLRQVVLNLLDNAFKFTPERGRITLKARQKGSSLIVEVQDTGRGIAKEKQERLFKPYHRLESDREQFSGLGLGLALCKNLVELHGGRIWVESHEGNGSTFSFFLPIEKSST